MNNSISKNRSKTEDDGGLKSLRDRRYCEKLEILGILKGGRLFSGDRATRSFLRDLIFLPCETRLFETEGFDDDDEFDNNG